MINANIALPRDYLIPSDLKEEYLKVCLGGIEEMQIEKGAV